MRHVARQPVKSAALDAVRARRVISNSAGIQRVVDLEAVVSVTLSARWITHQLPTIDVHAAFDEVGHLARVHRDRDPRAGGGLPSSPLPSMGGLLPSPAPQKL